MTLWYSTLTDTNAAPGDMGNSITTDTSGNVYVTGQQKNTAGYYIAFIAKYNSLGVIQWQRSLTDTNAAPNDIGFSITTDTSSNVYVTGQQKNTTGNYIVFIAKYNSLGVIQWQRSLTDTNAAPNDYSYSITTDTSSNVYVTGQQINTTGNYIAFIISLDSNGNYINTYNSPGAGITINAGDLTDATSALTDAAGALTDAAGTLTDAAGALTITNNVYYTGLKLTGSIAYEG